MDNWPKASIGNYKGVMLCNRPNEFGQQKRTENSGMNPFKSQVHIDNPLGWNQLHRLAPKVNRKKTTNGILLKHKMFLKELELKKHLERDILRQQLMEEDERLKLIKEQAQCQRNQISKEKETKQD